MIDIIPTRQSLPAPVALLLLATGVFAAGCGPDLPDDVEPVSEAPLWDYPDTVRVHVWGAMDEREPMPSVDPVPSVDWDWPDHPTLAWLQTHDYVFLTSRIYTVAVRLMHEGMEEPLTTRGGDLVVAGHRYFVRVK
jgi:hypothetical protein